jgi:hypothetical protein
MSKTIFWAGSLILIFWVVRNVVILVPEHGLAGFVGGTVADLRIWLLAIPLYVLCRRMIAPRGKGKGIANAVEAKDENPLD